jgi:hypothetical protein
MEMFRLLRICSVIPKRVYPQPARTIPVRLWFARFPSSLVTKARALVCAFSGSFPIYGGRHPRFSPVPQNLAASFA